MKIDKYFFQDVIVITDSIHRDILLKYASSKGIFMRCKIYTLEEVKKKYLFSYHEETLYEISKFSHVPYSVGKEYMKLLYFIDKKKSQNQKIKNLLNLWDHLKEKHYIIEDKTFQTFLKEKKIVMYELSHLLKEEKRWLSSIERENNVIFLEEEKKIKIHSFYKGITTEDEISFIADQILMLHKKIDINRIKIILLNNEYESTFKRIFHLYHIPFEFHKKGVLLSYDMTKYFLSLIKENEDIDDIPFLIRETYDFKDKTNEVLYQKLMTLFSKYRFIENRNDQFEILSFECKNTFLYTNEYQNKVSIFNHYENDFEEDDFLFIMGASLSYFPILYKDDDYLSDEEKEEIGVSSSSEKNDIEKKKWSSFLNTYEHIFISYAERSSQKEYAPSSFLELYKNQLKEIKRENLTFSYDYASYLLSKDLDNYMKYNEINESLPLLFSSIQTDFHTYKNEYKGILKENLSDYLNHKLFLSYTSLERFYLCQFRFFLEYILCIKDKKEENISLLFGNIVHEILRLTFSKEGNIKSFIEEGIDRYYKDRKKTSKDLFYIQKYKKEIYKMIEIVKYQQDHSHFKVEGVEKEYSYKIKHHDLEVKVYGKIDKVLSLIKENTKYTVIIDYKTGNTHLDLFKVSHGLSMQLFLYHLLLKKKENTSFAGVYLQNVLKDLLKSQKGKKYNELLYDAYKLDGYTLKNREIVQKIDKNEEDFIKTMRFKKDGDFYYNARVLNEKEIEKIEKIVEEKIEKAIFSIYEADFKINPKKFENEKDEATGCKYCPYLDICYMQSKDFVFIKKEDKKEVYE